MSVFPILPARRSARALQLSAPVLISGLCLWVLHQRLATYDLETLWRDGLTVPLSHWLGAFAATGISFWAVGRYDRVAHRHLRTGVTDRDAQRAGIPAIAFSQTLGFGLVTGSFARWRLIPALTPLMSLQLTTFVTVTFLTALALITALACVIAPPLPWLFPFGCAVLLGTVPLLGLAFFKPTFRVGRWPLRLPSLPAMAAITGWTILDTLAAFTAFYLLLPSGLALGWGALAPVFLLALAVALVSGTPGGVGPFELTLLALLPASDPGAVMTGIIGFRLVYYAVPAVLAGMRLFSPPRSSSLVAAPPISAPLTADLKRSETGVIRQNGGRILAHSDIQIAVLQTPQTLSGLFDPIAGPTPGAIDVLSAEARRTNTVPSLYKCSARTAHCARHHGWQVLRIAREAVIAPATFQTAGRAHRQLRRKLRHAAQSGLVITAAPPSLPVNDMQSVDQQWQAVVGPARGATMGRFDVEYLRHQQVYLAHQDNRLCGFVSFHNSRHEWCLDLMRTTADAPDGTMHALVTHAVTDAASNRVPRLSLAAVPDHRFITRRNSGLYQFKACFAPYWQPLYMAAPNWPALALAAADLARLVHWPLDLRPPPCPVPHEEDENNGFAMPRRA